MAWLLGVVALFAMVSALFTMAVGTSAIHQILTGVYFLTFTVACTGIGIIVAVDQMAKRLPKPRPQPQPLAETPVRKG